MSVHYFDPNGVLSLRENGYRDTAMALAELIDNSIQANATIIDIVIIERFSSQWLAEDIFVIDNGEGMDRETLKMALRFGGGTRHGAKKGLGKFGMGLPNSSASQTPRFEVYSWRRKNRIYYNYFDFNEIKEKQSEYLPEVKELDGLEIPANIFKQYDTGTLVKWKSCDRLILRRTNKLVTHIVEPLGRIFRYFINNDLDINIKVYQHNGEDYSERKELREKVKPLDPLFLMTDTQLDEPYNQEATSEKVIDDVLFPDTRKHKDLFERVEEQIKLKFSIAKQSIQLPTQAGGKGGGASKIGLWYRRMQGISVVRAGREIKLDDFKFITDVSDPTNRWWKVEVNFEPEFDHLFGLDNSKQNVHTFKYIPDDQKEIDLYEDDVIYWFQAELSKFIKDQINQLHKSIKARSEGTRGRVSSNSGSKEAKPSGPFPDDATPLPMPKPVDDTEEITNEEREEAKEWLIARYPSYAAATNKLEITLDWFFSNNFQQYIVFQPLGDNDLYSFKSLGYKTIIEINTHHDFYQTFIKEIIETRNFNQIDPLLLLFGALVEAEKENPSYQKYINVFRGAFGLKLNQYIIDWQENK